MQPTGADMSQAGRKCQENQSQDLKQCLNLKAGVYARTPKPSFTELIL